MLLNIYGSFHRILFEFVMNRVYRELIIIAQAFKDYLK